MSRSNAQTLKRSNCGLTLSVDAFFTIPTATILITLGTLKLLSQAERSILLNGVATTEIVLGTLLLLLRRSLFAQLPFLSVASAFFGASLMGLSANQTCDCFGEMEVAPIDRLLVSTLLFASALIHWSSARRVGFVTLIGMSTLAGVSAELWRSAATGGATEPIERLLPLELRRGEWEVTLIRTSCPACREHLQQRRSRLNSGGPQTALLILGPHQSWVDEYHRGFDAHFSILNSGSVPIRTPQVVVVSEGKLTSSQISTGSYHEN